MNAHTSLSRVAAYAALFTAALLMVPLLAMQFGNANWGAGDFVIAGALLFGTSFVFGLAMRAAGSIAHRVAAGLALFGGLFLVWSSLAVGLVGLVGLVGSSGEPVDLLYAAVLAVGIIGTIIVRYRPAGMARTLFVTAAAHAVITAIVLLLVDRIPSASPPAVLVRVNALFVLLFVGSGLLFRYASRSRPAAQAA